MDDSPRPTLLDLGRDSTPSSAITILEPSNSSSSSLTPAEYQRSTLGHSPADQYTARNPSHAKVHSMSNAHADQSQFNPGLDSPCFVHSYLDKGVTLWDTLKKQKKQMSSKARSDSYRRRHHDSDSATEEGLTSDTSQTPVPKDVMGAPKSSYFESATSGKGRSSAIDTQPDSGHSKTDDELHSGSDTSTVAQRKRVALNLQSENSDAEDDGESLSGRGSSYGSSYSYSSGDEDDKVRSLTRQLAETAVSVREMSKQLGRARVKSTIQSVLIITKARDNQLIKLTRELAIWLMTTPRNGKDTGLTVYVDAQLKRSKRFDAEGIKRDYPRLFETRPRWTPSTSSSMSSASGYESSNGFSRQEGQLRYWTSDMCSRSPHLFDFVVTLGGDGTVLFCSWLFQRIVPPVLPFALGSLGFLTNFDFVDYEKVMKSALEDGIRVNLRMRFTATVYRATLPTTQHAERSKRRAIRSGKTGEIIMRSVRNCGWDAIESPDQNIGERSRHTAEEEAASTPKKKKACRDKEVMCFSTRPVETFEVLNDLVVDRGPSPYVSQLELFGDEHHMTTAQADGICISTPTGSTAYSLSAGGSLVHPEIPAILITPICPHTLSFRPMLLPDSIELRIAVPYNSRSTAWASFDGRGRVELKQGDHIKVTASRYPFPTVCAEDQSVDWFFSISRTLKWNERQRQKSFVVVEEGGESSTEHGQRKKEGMTFSKSVADDDDDESDEGKEQEETDENEEEEAEHFDIDDTSTTVTRSNSPSQSHPGTSGELHRRRSSNHSHSHGKAGSVGGGSHKSSNGGILPTNSNGVPRLTALTPSHPPSSCHDPLLNSPDRFGIQGPPLPPKAISERHMLSADFRLDDDGSTERRHLQRAEKSKARDHTPTMKKTRRKRTEESGNGTALVVYGDDESDSSTTGA